MQPQTPRKPVMDVAAPVKSPAPAQPASTTPVAPVPPTPTPAPAPTTPSIPESRAPLEVKAPPAPAETPAQAAAAMPLSADLHANQAAQKPAKPRSKTPTALITFTILAMLVLAGLAVVVYVTSQSS